jgi:hypothetical protein
VSLADHQDVAVGIDEVEEGDGAGVLDLADDRGASLDRSGMGGIDVVGVEHEQHRPIDPRREPLRVEQQVRAVIELEDVDVRETILGTEIDAEQIGVPTGRAVEVGDVQEDAANVLLDRSGQEAPPRSSRRGAFSSPTD